MLAGPYGRRVAGLFGLKQLMAKTVSRVLDAEGQEERLPGLGETSRFGLSGDLESRTATSSGRLRATSTQLPLWLL